MDSSALTGIKTAMGSFGRITSIADLATDKDMIAMIKEAVKLNEDGVKVPNRSKFAKKTELMVPPDLMAALKKNSTAKSAFEKFSYTNKKEYVLWLEESKTETTRQKRLATAIEWISGGKIRNWKYVR